MCRIVFSKQLAQYLPPDKPYAPAYGSSAGLDLYATEDRVIYPIAGWSEGEPLMLIPTGIHMQLEASEVGLIVERGSVVKTPLKVRAGVVDPGFSGQVFINCVNLNSTPYRVRAGQKLPFQLLVIPFIFPRIEYVDDLDQEVASWISARGKGQIGSSDSQ